MAGFKLRQNKTSGRKKARNSDFSFSCQNRHAFSKRLTLSNHKQNLFHDCVEIAILKRYRLKSRIPRGNAMTPPPPLRAFLTAHTA